MKSSNTFYWTVTSNCQPFTYYMLQPFLVHYQGGSITKRRYKDAVLHVSMVSVVHLQM
jgi:hypothetical protein